MYNFKVPATGIATVPILGMTFNSSLISMTIGLVFIIIGFKLLRLFYKEKQLKQKK